MEYDQTLSLNLIREHGPCGALVAAAIRAMKD